MSQMMIQRIDFNPYAYRATPKADGLDMASFRTTLLEMFPGTHYCPKDAHQLRANLASLPDYSIRKAELVISMSPQVKLNEFLSSPPVYATGTPTTNQWRMAMAVKLSQMRTSNYVTSGPIEGLLYDLRCAADEADYSGMNNAEKAKTIFDRYDKAFGDWRKMYAIGTHGRSEAEANYRVIQKQFNDELTSVFGSVEKANAAYKTAIFGNMSDADIRAEIAAKYPPMNEITLREFNYMTYEMNQFGADGGMYWVLQRAMGDLGDDLSMWENLDKPLNVSLLTTTYNNMRNALAKTFHNDVGNSGAVMRELFGVTFDNRGNAISNQRRPVDLNTLMGQAVQSYSNWSAKDFEDWLLNQFQKEYDEWLARWV